MVIHRSLYVAAAVLAFASCPLGAEASFSPHVNDVSEYSLAQAPLSVPFLEIPSDAPAIHSSKEDTACDTLVSIGVPRQKCADCAEILMRQLFEVDGVLQAQFIPDLDRITITLNTGTAVSDSDIRGMMFAAGYTPGAVVRHC